MMRPLQELVPDIAARETWTFIVDGIAGLLPGEYAFHECYCDDPTCDCRHVQFIARRRGSDVDWAYIDFGWESAAFYAKLCRSSLVQARRLCKPSLCGMKKQSPYARILLDLLSKEIVKPSGKSLLAWHYRLFKEALEAEILDLPREEEC